MYLTLGTRYGRGLQPCVCAAREIQCQARAVCRCGSALVDQTSAFWYVRQTEKGKEYVKVDAASKKRTALFDQQKMASALTEKAGREINAYNLPLQNCRLNISLDTLRFQLDGKFWAYSIKITVCWMKEQYLLVERNATGWKWTMRKKVARLPHRMVSGPLYQK